MGRVVFSADFSQAAERLARAGAERRPSFFELYRPWKPVQAAEPLSAAAGVC
jgi:hypothetical protein